MSLYYSSLNSEHDFSADQLGRINRFKTSHRLRLTMAGLRSFLSKDKQMQETRWVALFLPGQIHLRARLIGLNVVHIHAKYHAALVKAEFRFATGRLVGIAVGCPPATQTRLGTESSIDFLG
jgi:hypothetical protein